MRINWKYLLVGLLVFGLVFVVALPFFFRGFGGYGGYGMMGPGGMMRGWGFGPMMGGLHLNSVIAALAVAGEQPIFRGNELAFCIADLKLPLP